jgi:hypothetical protein
MGDVSLSHFLRESGLTLEDLSAVPLGWIHLSRARRNSPS